MKPNTIKEIKELMMGLGYTKDAELVCNAIERTKITDISIIELDDVMDKQFMRATHRISSGESIIYVEDIVLGRSDFYYPPLMVLYWDMKNKERVFNHKELACKTFFNKREDINKNIYLAVAKAYFKDKSSTDFDYHIFFIYKKEDK